MYSKLESAVWLAPMRIARRDALFGLAASTLLCAGCNRNRRSRLTGPARRVVSISPSTTEALFAIGAGDRVVGRSRYCDYPPEATQLPTVGGFVDPNLEAVLTLRPDLVTGARGPAGRTLADTLSARGVATYFPPTESMAQIDAMVLGVAERVGMPEAGVRQQSEMRQARAHIVEAVRDLSKPTVLLLFGLTPIVVAGPGSFANEMLTLGGGRNAVTAASTVRLTTYPTLDIEQVITLNPDSILNAATSQHGNEQLGAGWSLVRAVREGRMIALSGEAVLRPGPRIADGLAQIARAIHPGLTL